MSQNLVAFIAKAYGGGVGLLNLDSSGNLLVALNASPEGTLPVSMADGADVTLGSKADAAWASGSGSAIALLKAIAEKQGGLPVGATAIQATSGNVTNASAVATLAAATGKTTWLTGFALTGMGSTSALGVTATLTGPATELYFNFGFPAGVGVPATPLVVNLPVPIPASAVDTAIVLTLPAGGSGNAFACASAWGYQL